MEYTLKQIQNLTGEKCYAVYEQFNHYILDSYNIDQLWGEGGKAGAVCLRYNRGGKTLCTVFFRPEQLGIQIVLGKEEQRKFEEAESRFSETVRNIYKCTKTYHDGKWLMFDVDNTELFNDIKALLAIKKSPNRTLTMCGYCCDMCKAFVGNIRKKDEREQLAGYWKRYYGLNIPVENMKCDGCRCKRNNAHRVDDACPVRACVLSKELNGCLECANYPCDIWRSRKGLSQTEANTVGELDILSYYEYLGAYDNRSRLERKRKENH